MLKLEAAEAEDPLAAEAAEQEVLLMLLPYQV
jgi:hypothetical protein